ncbi:MAG: FimV/HubP family polar landmark protein [Massilia sp.]
MRLNTRSKISSFALKTLSGAVASAVFLSSSAYAAGLGKLTVLSGLGQPLSAEIELTAVATDDASTLVAKLAPADAFRVANIDFNPALLSLRFAVEQRGTRQFIKITSTQPVNEPFVDMLLELSWNSGKLVREYTFLLDPSDIRSTQPAQVSAPVDVLANSRAVSSGTNVGATKSVTAGKPVAEKPVSDKPVAEKPSRRAPSAAPAPSERSATDTEYKVKAGDTLGKIAANLKPAEVSLDMMLVALYRANPDAFNGNNMNRLKSGQILAVPDENAIKASSDSDARGVVVAHAADFNAYRNKLAGQVANAAPDKAPTASQSAGGKITAKVEEHRTPANEAKDQLKLSKAGSPTDANGKSAAAAEDKIAKDKALADANARVKELERNVSELEKLMVIKNKAAADAQKAASAQKPAPVVVPPPPVVAPAKPAAVASAPVPAAKPAPVPVPAASVPAPVPVPVPVPPPVVASAPAPLPTPAASVPAPEVKPAAKPAAKIAVVKKAEAPAEPGIVDMLKDNLLIILGGLAVVAGGTFLFLKKRGKGDSGSGNEPSILGAPTDQAHSLFAETGGQSVDTSNSVFNSSFAPSASQLDTNEVDPVAEADVYIAYGRDAQAEEILKEALRTHPERYPVRLKLLEIYAARKDLRSFETQATDLYSMTKGQGDEWSQAAALGLAIDPANPLYAGAAAAGPATVIPAAAEPVVLAKQAVLDDVPTDLDLSDVTAVPAAAAAAAPAAEDHSLDFDLGGLSFEPVAQTAAPIAPAAPVAAAAAEPEDMAFNMDFDAPAAPVAKPAKNLHDIDIGLDVPSTDLSAEYAAGKADMSGMGDLASAFNIPSGPAHAPAAEQPLDLGAMNFDLPTSAAAPAAAPSFDMSSIDLDLPPVDTAAANDGFANTMVMETGDQSAVHMEMETKLDLAIAYQEIGDKEGARELLDEVIKGGSSEQVGKATSMRAKLA